MEYPLKSIVSKKASSINITLHQNPEIRIQHQHPKPSLAQFDDDKAKQLFIDANKSVASGKSFDSDIVESIQKNLDNGVRSIHGENLSFKSILQGLEFFPGSFVGDDVKSDLMSNSEKIFDSKGRESFETQTGFTIIGNQIMDVVVNGGIDIFSEDNKEQIRVYQDDTVSSALIILGNRQSIPVAVLKGYIGTLVFDSDRLLTINYTPSGNNYKYYDFKANENEINFVRAFVASAANNGFDYQQTFKNEFDNNGYLKDDNAGSYLRREKSLDPSLGLYAVYAYRQAGKIKDIKSVHKYMTEESDKMIFDVAMLAGKLEIERERLAPFCPMLSLGWAYRQRFERYLHPQIIKASNLLLPNLWTTFDEKGTELILSLYKENLIK